MIQRKKPTQPTISESVQDLLYQALETELGGVEIYRSAVRCARNADLKREWQKYLAQTERHVERMREVLESLELDPERLTAGRKIVRQIGKSLVEAMESALEGDAPAAAELVATECVVFAETKDHQNWSLLAKLVEADVDQRFATLAEACAAVEDEEDEHLEHSQGWSRELWMRALDLESRLPPPAEREDVRSAKAAAQVKRKPRSRA
jgi:rubrerythrin